MRKGILIALALLFQACEKGHELEDNMHHYHQEFSDYKKVAKSGNAVVYRYKLSDDSLWEKAKREIAMLQGKESFVAYVDFLDDDSLAEKDWRDVTNLLGSAYQNPVIFVVDEQFESDGTLAVYDLLYERGNSFRLYPMHVQVVENNLTIGNLAFYEFKETTINGIYHEPE